VDEALPTFRFHPDPVRSGSVARSDVLCEACGRTRGWAYAGPCHAETELDGRLCPWCIADGTAHARFDVTFHDVVLPADVDPGIADEIEQRTPGFATFQPIDWPACCGVPMGYVEPCGIAEVRARHAQLEGELMATIVHDLGRSGAAARRMLESLRRDDAPCVHVFACAACGARRGQIDAL